MTSSLPCTTDRSDARRRSSVSRVLPDVPAAFERVCSGAALASKPGREYRIEWPRFAFRPTLEMVLVNELGRSFSRYFRRSLGGALLASLASVISGCSTAALPTAIPTKPVAPAPPPKDDGKPAQGGPGGDGHSAALEQLRTAPLAPKTDKQNSVVIQLPDGGNWTRVRFLTVPGLVGFRYGKSHHAIVAGFVTHVDDNTVEGACSKSFESWAMPWVEAFEVDLHHDAPAAFSWTIPASPVVRPANGAPALSPVPKRIAIVEVDPLYAKTATVLSRESYAAAWASYPAWDKACLIVGVAIPARDDEPRAREVRDRFVKEVLPAVVVTAPTEPKERF